MIMCHDGYCGLHCVSFFFFQAEDGIRDVAVTGVQTCALPISPGHQPCTETETRAGIWRYDANRTAQRFSPAERFVTGIRNAGGIAVDSTGIGIYATQHGRDQLAENWPALYKPEQGANLPAEELLRLERGADYWWPECYFDDTQQKLVH